MTDEKFVCARCKEIKAENNNNYTLTTYREWESGILCKSCYTYLKSENYVKELHTIYPVFIPYSSHNHPYWDWADSISNTKGLVPVTATNFLGGGWYELINALLQTHGLSLEELENKIRFKLLFSSHSFPDHQVTLEFADASRNTNHYQIYRPESMTVKPLRGALRELFPLTHHTAIFWFNCTPRYIYLKSELLKEEGKK